MHLPGALLANSTGPRSNTATCDDLNHCRKPSHIVWSCLSTIFIYTYVSMHLNAPSPRKGILRRCARVIKMMMFAFVAPELFVGFAFRQFCTASRFMEGFRQDPNASHPEFHEDREATRTEGFFFAMGGFASTDGHPIVMLSDFREYRYPKGDLVDPRPWLRRKKSEIVDAVRSLLPKQTEDHEEPEEHPALLMTPRERMVADIKDKSNKNLLAKAFAVLQGFWFIFQCGFRLNQRLPLTQLEVMTVAYGGVNIFIWSLWWYKPIGVDQPIRLLRVDEEEEDEDYVQIIENKERPKRAMLHIRAMSMIMGFYPLYKPTIDHSVPEFWSSDPTTADINRGFIVECAVGCLFGWIHVAAWNSDFRTPVELWIWRGSAVAVTCVPLLFAVLILLPGSGRIFQRFFFYTVCAPLFILYATGRLLLVGIAFAALRALPEPALEDVSWSSWFPHIT
ncbi:hypothetical protein MIND_00376600 [Mycena indigotica]|uniref:Uncharacterized protein n=1 Tax=Mycena indigotica TaxID=2126181 RepID=A0A8H6WBA8_9AGAR|nr:uncharacterized protein MIND_00376600 [Mycena indigotica]KAF7310036.1 hypothetical protein MIND_00376600 [Mycena indigotica]